MGYLAGFNNHGVGMRDRIDGAGRSMIAIVSQFFHVWEAGELLLKLPWLPTGTGSRFGVG